MELSAEQKSAIEAQKQQCPFCQIIAGKIPATKVFDDGEVIAILDINPARPGHLLVMPKEHYPIMPLIPPKTFDHLFSRVRSISKHLRKAMLAKNASVFIANGPAAGQQSSHFLIHIIPSDKPLDNFKLKSEMLSEQDISRASEMLRHNLPLMLRDMSVRFPLTEEVADEQETISPESTPSRLAQMIAEHPELRQMIMEKPEAVRAGLADNPSLAPMFEGVDIDRLSQRLREQSEAERLVEAADEGPRNFEPEAPKFKAPPEDVGKLVSERPPDVPNAADMSNLQLAAFINDNERLRDLLIHELETLQRALLDQPKLQSFFRGTSPGEVRARYLDASAPIGGDSEAETRKESRRW